MYAIFVDQSVIYRIFTSYSSYHQPQADHFIGLSCKGKPVQMSSLIILSSRILPLDEVFIDFELHDIYPIFYSEI